jgi:hypothetical protein
LKNSNQSKLYPFHLIQGDDIVKPFLVNEKNVVEAMHVCVKKLETLATTLQQKELPEVIPLNSDSTKRYSATTAARRSSQYLDCESSSSASTQHQNQNETC